MIRLSLVNVGVVEETGSVILVLRAPELARLLVMEVGVLEGRAIAMAAQGVEAPRPLTHDLLLQAITKLGAEIFYVEIREFRDKVFYATLVLKRADGTLVELDCRPSDGIALVLRNGAPIYASEDVLAVAGVDEQDVETEEAEEWDEEPGEDDPNEPDDDGVDDPPVH
jgi:bifunctional DNase/RNase